MKKMLLLTGLLALIGAACALSLDVDIPANAWQGESRGIQTSPLLEPGVPALNYLPVRVLIPFGEKVENVSVTLSEPELTRSGVILDHVQAQQPISVPLARLTEPDPEIWGADAPYPARDFAYLGTQSMRGHNIAVINIYPWKYNPVRGEVYASAQTRIEIETTWDEETAVRSANFLAPALDDSDVRDLVLNPGAINSYNAFSSYRSHTPQSRLIDLSVPKKMIIITDADSEPLFQNYAQWRSSQNVSTGIFLTSDIYSEYTGADNAEKVRNFITDAYMTWANSSDPLHYVILGGDDEIVPERGCYGQVGNTVDQRMPTDIYFSNLDGNWNADGDNIWGEQLDDVDMLPEVHIGRFPAQTAAEFDNILRKTQYYVNNSTFSNNISIMFGENLNNNPLTWGGDYKDDVANHIPDNYFMQTLYQRDGNYDAQSVWNAINLGANVMNHMGHANETYLMGQGNNTIELLDNTEYGFLYTQGCYPAAFDQRTSGDGESIGEHMVTTDGGLFAFIGNTRYGWYMPGGINGASQFYDREYFIGLFETLYTRLGQALTYSRLQNLNAALSYDVMRWCYYEMVLFGDPSIEVKYPDPSLPLLSLEDYTITDEEGDNDGSLNPGEVLRIYPTILNQEGWNTACDVTATLTNLPDGVQTLAGQLVIPQIQPGQTSDPSLYFRVQLPQEATYGIFHLNLQLESIHPVTQTSTGIRNYRLDYDITLIDNRFPWDCQVGTKSAPIVHDLDDDGSLDITYLDVYGESYFVNNSGQQFGGYFSPPVQDIMRSSAMGDITGDGSPEVVYASRTGRVHASTPDGTQVFDYDGGSQFLFTPVIATLDDSGADKVLVNSLDGNLHAINDDGTSVNGFPVNLGAAYFTELAAADLDSDGLMEVIAGTTDGNLHVISPSGNYLPGFPIQLSGMISGSPTVLDNGNIAVGTNSNMYLVSPQGGILFSKGISAAMASGPVLADLDLDGELEIICVTLGGRVFAVDQGGNDLDGFPVDTGAIFNSPPLVANLDSDPNPEILLSSYVNSTYAYNHDGTGVGGFPFVTSFNGSTPGTLCDFDGDGMLKLVNGYSTGILVLNLRRPATNVMPWITYRGSLKRQGSFASTGYVPISDPVVPAYANELAQNYPNPFNPSTTIAFQTAKDGLAKLSVYNVKGQLVRVLKEENLRSGNHSVVWDGTDEAGKEVSSGLYFYRLDTRDETITRRMLLVK